MTMEQLGSQPSLQSLVVAWSLRAASSRATSGAELDVKHLPFRGAHTEPYLACEQPPTSTHCLQLRPSTVRNVHALQHIRPALPNKHNQTQNTHLPQLLLKDGLLPFCTVEFKLSCFQHPLSCCYLSLSKQLVCSLTCVGCCCCILLCCCCQGILQNMHSTARLSTQHNPAGRLIVVTTAQPRRHLRPTKQLLFSLLLAYTGCVGVTCTWPSCAACFVHCMK